MVAQLDFRDINFLIGSIEQGRPRHGDELTVLVENLRTERNLTVRNVVVVQPIEAIETGNVHGQAVASWLVRARLLNVVPIVVERELQVDSAVNEKRQMVKCKDQGIIGQG